MNSTAPLTGYSILVFAALATWGCDFLTGTKDPKIGISLTTDVANVGQGGNASVTITIARTNFDKDIALSAQGLPQGVTATFNPTNVTGGVTTSTLVLDAAPNALPATSTITITASGEGVADATTTLSLTVTVTGSYTLAVMNPTVTVAQGGAGSTVVLVNRVNAYGGDVSLTLSGAPSGVTATLDPTATASGFSLLSIVATAGAATGTQTLTITGTSPGLPDQPASVSVAVISPPSTASVTVPFCSGLPVWAAYQNEGYGWQRVEPSGGSITFNATERLSFAHVFQSQQETDVRIVYATRAELATVPALACRGSKTLGGSVAGVASDQVARVTLGRSVATPTSTAPNYTLTQLGSGPLDLVAVRGTSANETDLVPNKVILRRGVDLTDGSTIPALDFAAEGFAPATSTLTINGLATGAIPFVINSLWTAAGTIGLVHLALLPGNSVTLRSIPNTELATGDIHELSVQEYRSGLQSIEGRGYDVYVTAITDRTVDFGPSLSGVTFTTIGTTPYFRTWVRLASQPEYNSVVLASYVQETQSTARFVDIIVTSGYAGGTPAAWDLAVPDFTGAAGFTGAWFPSGIASSFVTAVSGAPQLYFAAPRVNGDLQRYAFRLSQPLGLRQLTRLRFGDGLANHAAVARPGRWPRE